MTYLLNLSYMSLYSIKHQEYLFLGIGISIGIGIGHTYSIAEQYADPILQPWILQQINYCVNDVFAKFIVHVTVQH